MRIAILTQPLGKNYGGLMQAYALQKCLRDAGHYVITVDRQHNKPNIFRYLARGVYRYILMLIGRERVSVYVERNKKKIYAKNYSFMRKNIEMSQTIDTNSKMVSFSLNNQFDAYIVGSDQTWRPLYSANIFNFFLDFVEHKDVKKVAYASSFGVDFWDFDEVSTTVCGRLAKLFDAISVREESGVELCNKYLGVESVPVLDPTFLLADGQYHELILNIDPLSRGGIFSYILDQTDNKNNFSQQLAKTLKLKIQVCEPEVTKAQIFSSTDLEKPSVLEWLSSIANSDFVITDSFHGVVFSLIFEREFVAIVNEDRGAARFHSLLRQLDLSERVLTNLDVIDFGVFSRKIDYFEVKNKLKKLKECSMDFLFDSIA